MINLTILNSRETVFEGKVKTVLIPGDKGDFEVLSYHKPLISLLRRGKFILDDKRVISISRGIVRVHHNHIVALIEQ